MNVRYTPGFPPFIYHDCDANKKGLPFWLLLDAVKVPLLPWDEARFKYNKHKNKNIYSTLGTQWERQGLNFIEDFLKVFRYSQSKVQSHISSSNQTRHFIFKCFPHFSILDIHKDSKTYFPSSEHQVLVLNCQGSANINCTVVNIFMVLQIDPFEGVFSFNMYAILWHFS